MRKFRLNGALEFPANPNLILVGTVHGDPRGYDRALRLLEYFKPGLITVEISPFSVRYRERHGAGWRRRLETALGNLPAEAARHLALRRVAAQLELPFEYRAARDYGEAGGAAVQLIDVSRPAREHLPRYRRELLTPSNLRALLDTADGDLGEYVAAQFQQARAANNGTRPAPAHTWDREIRRRERLLAVRLRRLAGPGLLVVHLGGWEHLTDRGAGLLPYLAGLNYARIFLDSADCLKERVGGGGPGSWARLQSSPKPPPPTP
jgi:hypothetical protein